MVATRMILAPPLDAPAVEVADAVVLAVVLVAVAVEDVVPELLAVLEALVWVPVVVDAVDEAARRAWVGWPWVGLATTAERAARPAAIVGMRMGDDVWNYSKECCGAMQQSS